MNLPCGNICPESACFSVNITGKAWRRRERMRERETVRIISACRRCCATFTSTIRKASHCRRSPGRRHSASGSACAASAAPCRCRPCSMSSGIRSCRERNSCAAIPTGASRTPQRPAASTVPAISPKCSAGITTARPGSTGEGRRGRKGTGLAVRKV